jgi:hypothetical protein
MITIRQETLFSKSTKNKVDVSSSGIVVPRLSNIDREHQM